MWEKNQTYYVWPQGLEQAQWGKAIGIVEVNARNNS